MPFLLRETNTALRVVILGAYVIAVVFCGAGIWLVYLGASGASEMSVFGAQLKSTSVGVASLFLGAIIVVLLIRRSLQTMETAIQRETPSETDRDTMPDVWPSTKTRKALGQKLATLSIIQWTIIQTVEQMEGQGIHHVAEACHAESSSHFFHRLRSLEADGLVVIHKGNVHLSREVKQALGRRHLTDLRPPN